MGGWSSVWVGVFKMRRLLSNRELANDVANVGSHSWQSVSEGSVLVLLSSCGEMGMSLSCDINHNPALSVLSSWCGEKPPAVGKASETEIQNNIFLLVLLEKKKKKKINLKALPDKPKPLMGIISREQWLLTFPGSKVSRDIGPCGHKCFAL